MPKSNLRFPFDRLPNWAIWVCLIVIALPCHLFATFLEGIDNWRKEMSRLHEELNS